MPNKNKKFQALIKKSWKDLIISLFYGLILAASVYLIFLQPNHVISKMRLAIAAAFWVLFTIGIFALLHFDVLKTHGIKPKLLMTSLIIGLLFSSLFLWLTFDLQELPYNLLLLPKQNLKISFMCSEDGDQTAELKYFHNGLSIISYSVFQKEGNWDRTQDSLRAIDCSGASLSYYGWLVEQPYIVFRTQPDSGELELRWNGISQTADLNSPEIGELKFNQDFGYEPLNKISVFITFAIAFAAIIFPLALMIAKDILHEDTTFSLGQWFNETGERFLQLIGIVIIFTCFTTVILFLTPLFAKDKTPVQIKQPEPNQYPNIILILVDSLAAQDMSISGYALQTTPHLDRITKEWTVYTNANTISTCTIRIFPSLITGRYPDFAYPLSRFGQLISTSSDWVNILQMFSDIGYETWWQSYKAPGMYHSQNGIDEFLFTKTQNLFRTWYFPDSVRQRNYPYYPFLLEKTNIQVPWDIGNRAVDVLGDMMVGREFQEPFFIYMHYRGVHADSYNSGKYTGEYLPLEEGLISYDDQHALLGAYPPESQPQVDKLRLRYDEAILNEDEAISLLIDKIKQTDYYDSSMIIITGDHGQVFNNGFTSHCTPLISYSETHVPLFIKYPYQTEGNQVDALVSLVDLTPTILDTAGILYSDDWFNGTSLFNLEFQNKIHDFVFVRSDYTHLEFYYPSVSVMNEQYKLVQRTDGFYLYDYINDPTEQVNLISEESFNQDLLEKMKNALGEINPTGYYSK